MGDRKDKGKAERLEEDRILEEDKEVLADTQEEEPQGAEAEGERTAEEEINDLHNRYLRVCADFDNFRRRSRQDRSLGYEEGVIEAVRALLPVADSIEAALKAADNCLSEETREFAEGVTLIASQLQEAFRKLGVTEIEGEGAAFDPNVHQAILHAEDDGQPENCVAEVFQKGYVKGDRVIRHSLVKVVN